MEIPLLIVFLKQDIFDINNFLIGWKCLNSIWICILYMKSAFEDKYCWLQNTHTFQRLKIKKGQYFNQNNEKYM